MKESINYLAVGTSAVVSLLLSYVWFMVLFFKPYAEALGKTKEEMDKGPTALQASAMQLIGNFVLAFVLAWLMKKLGYTTLIEGLKFGAFIWVGFVAAVLAPMYAFQAYSIGFFLMTSGSVLMTLLASGAILGAWQ
ncbi:DUF1761 domain-containing protein [Emticicia agri]|uniref:DUF1761 domain-containing protein n=1 Tax=Emticicia agri TaxID=2492393 RepID=A0A4Q5LWQ3_9BACT|nr:DUF1761 domain-containing protein [Emticicia agri]RYU94231.1 DUF1761 domain-containing protein [Emticicia agri]